MITESIGRDIYHSDETLKLNSAGCRNTDIHHAELRATDPAASARFCRDVRGMQTVAIGWSDVLPPWCGFDF